MARHDPGKLGKDIPVGLLVGRVAGKHPSVAGKIALHAEKGKHELLEIGPLVLAETVRDMQGIVR